MFLLALIHSCAAIPTHLKIKREKKEIKKNIHHEMRTTNESQSMSISSSISYIFFSTVVSYLIEGESYVYAQRETRERRGKLLPDDVVFI